MMATLAQQTSATTGFVSIQEHAASPPLTAMTMIPAPLTHAITSCVIILRSTVTTTIHARQISVITVFACIWPFAALLTLIVMMVTAALLTSVLMVFAEERLQIAMIMTDARLTVVMQRPDASMHQSIAMMATRALRIFVIMAYVFMMCCAALQIPTAMTAICAQ
jgi:hypothetical protein